MNRLKSEIDNPRVSVLLPFYRPGRKPEYAIKSIIDQTFTDWELIYGDSLMFANIPVNSSISYLMMNWTARRNSLSLTSFQKGA